MQRLSLLSLNIFLLMQCAVSVYAVEQTTDGTDNTTVNVLPTIEVNATDDTQAYAATTASAVLRSDAPLFETAQSISVISEKQLQEK